MKKIRALVFLTMAVSFWTATPAAACMIGGDRHQVFFGARPAEVPSGLIVLKVQAPEKVDENSPFSVTVLESADSIPSHRTVLVKVDTQNEADCDVYDLGVLGQPAYIFGVYERADDGPVYFRALWLRPNYSALKRQRRWTSYIVDPALRAAAEASRK